MNNVLMQSQAELKILEFKLDKIRKRLEERISIVDPVTKQELQVILNMIEEFEEVPINWTLQKPLVPLNEEVSE